MNKFTTVFHESGEGGGGGGGGGWMSGRGWDGEACLSHTLSPCLPFACVVAESFLGSLISTLFFCTLSASLGLTQAWGTDTQTSTSAQ